MTLRVGIYVYPDVEVLDFAGPYEVFSTAARVALRLQRAQGQPDEAAPERAGGLGGRVSSGPPARPAPPFSACLVAATREPVRARAGFTVLPDHAIDDHPPLDVLIVPGGVHEPELERPEVIAWIARQAAAARLTASVCTGAFLLARAGLLAGLDVTTHWEDCADLQRSFPDLRVREGVRWLEHERIMTSAGISAGLDMSLRIVTRLASQDLAERTARQMDYDWRRRDGAGAAGA